ncbi:hypothetical protein M9H77_22215 [Catharanthus roseus]|uniref:Uncharacterized protein n=1 Tax=Catharanthus roseus TaxID=4058 RepID=A0ACC0APH1_CATRO|nr:hypothetical protein M9H77_22215 [Catharanthus roseus]
MDVENTTKFEDKSTHPNPPKRRRRRRKTICLLVTALLLLLGLILLILALTVFKAKRPVTSVNSVSLRDFDLSFDSARFRVLINVTLDASLQVTNPNRVGFRYTQSSALLKYRGDVVGEVPIPAGKIGARQTRDMNITLTIMADRLLSNSNLYSDAVSGTLPFSTYTRISGHVRILFKIHVVSYTNCDFAVDVMRSSLANQTCHYKTKL